MTDRRIADLPDAIEDAVLAALELDDATARDDALARIRAAHPDHAEAIRCWLAAVDGVPPTVPATPPGGAGIADAGASGAAAHPDHIGAYRLVRILGRGGFGTVYLAEQEQPFQRQVAIKVLNPGMDSGEILRRFTGEREALNRMNHPGIARLLDAGATAEGRPFFVMEYVPGVAIGLYARQRELPLDARLDLYQQVLDAVQHAHQKAVIHRDLSSNNVLVAEIDGRPQPKIIDFGIAKSLAAPLQEGWSLTFQGTLMGTPEFMSPEQARGLADIDTRADIYALGVLLYELLTDRLPIPTVVLRSQGVAGMAKVIAEHMPLRPSVAAPAGRQAALRGDLDSIVMAALAKDRDERYPSVGELAADLDRYRNDLPIARRAPTVWYRLRKFARRNLVQVLAGLLVLAALLVALGVSLYALDRARTAQAGAEAAQTQARLRADAGFRLLGHIQRLQDAREREVELWPPWPAQVPAMQAWLSQVEDHLVRDLPAMRQKLDELRAGAPQGQFGDAGDEYLYETLTRLEREVAEFAAAGGPLDSMRRRLQWARTIEHRSLHQHRERWQQATDAIKASDGRSANRQYRGLQFPPQIGLVPLGQNPATGLWEFLDLASHPATAPIPVRDPQTGQLRIGPDTGIVLVLLPPGEFWMGAMRGEPGLEQNDPLAADDEQPVRPVMLDAFFLARTELTQAQWAALADGEAPARHQGGPQFPVESVDWHRAGEILRRWGMALPTEAEWEYACRAGRRTPWHCGADPERVPTMGWFGPTPTSVGLLEPNAFGLFDLHGNVAEWCRDAKTDYRVTPRRGDGMRESDGEVRVARGGAGGWPVEESRCSARKGLRPDTRDGWVGMRAMRPLLR